MAVDIVAQAVVKGKVENQDYRNVMHFAYTGEDFPADPNAILLALADAIFACFIQVLLPNMSSSHSFESCSAKQIFPNLSDEAITVANAGPGGHAGDALPTFVSRLVDIRTGGGGRRHRGRMFLPPPREADSDESTLSVAGLTDVTDFCLCFIGKFVGVARTEPWGLGVVSRAAIQKDGQTIGQAFKLATNMVGVPLLAVQRRRKIGKGS